jgi:hypothetical protein
MYCDFLSLLSNTTHALCCLLLVDFLGNVFVWIMEAILHICHISVGTLYYCVVNFITDK